jgi:hypothetical protein
VSKITRVACSDPGKATLTTEGLFAQLSTRDLRECPECWGGCHTHGDKGRVPCAEREGWRRVHLYNKARIPSSLALVDMAQAAVLTSSPLSSAWRWLKLTPGLPSMWVHGDHKRRDHRVVLAALTHDLTTAQGVSARYITLPDLADLIVDRYRAGEGLTRDLRHVQRVSVLLLAGLDGGMRERDARALRWVASKRQGAIVFGATSTSREISEEAGRLLTPSTAPLLRSWMSHARPMGWT